jgi:alkylation response protein AidB-like acyl-CoA dehydrogenase
MQFSFSDQQLEFQAAVRQVLTNECTPADLRSAYQQPTARSPRWATVTDLGVVGLTVPDQHGGLGLGLLDLVLLLEEAGRVALPEPLVETTALAVPLLAESTSPQAGQWLELIAAGEVAVAVAPFDYPHNAVVPGAVGADLYLLPTVDDSGGIDVHAVPAAEVTVTPVASLDPTRRLGTVAWEPSPATRVTSGPEGAQRWADLADRAAVATAAELVGLADRMITLGAEYAKDRNQFGKPIGSFQAVKHLLAGAQVKLEFARPVTYAAAWALDNQEPGGSRSASLAKAYASDAATEAARVSLQVHGAIGYTWECDLQLYLKRAWALAEAWGSAADHRQRILTSLVNEH